MSTGKAIRQQVLPEEIVPPPPAPNTNSSVSDEDERNLTISTKLSHDRLILCKTPQECDTKSEGVVTAKTPDGGVATNGATGFSNNNVMVCLSLLQIFFGILMCTFGVLVIINASSLSQIGGGIWGGCLSMSAGVSGIVSSAKIWCPLRRNALKVAQTVNLALNLVTLAIAQLVVVIAATGIARDVYKLELNADNLEVVDNVEEVLPYNYGALVANCFLVLVAGLDCLCAAVCSYRSARTVCPCFNGSAEANMTTKHLDGNLHENMRIGGDGFVHSWLSKQGNGQIYVVRTAPSSTLSSRHSKISGGILLPPPAMTPSNIYTLIPAPLGQIPPPPPTLPRESRHYRRMARHHSPQYVMRDSLVRENHRRSPRKEELTTEELAKTYTGLDRAIAEEFIEICDSKQNSLCCSNDGSLNHSQCCCAVPPSQGEMGSRDYLIDHI